MFIRYVSTLCLSYKRIINTLPPEGAEAPEPCLMPKKTLSGATCWRHTVINDKIIIDLYMYYYSYLLLLYILLYIYYYNIYYGNILFNIMLLLLIIVILYYYNYYYYHNSTIIRFLNSQNVSIKNKKKSHKYIHLFLVLK